MSGPQYGFLPGMAQPAKAASRPEHHSRPDELKHRSGASKLSARHRRKNRQKKTSKADKRNKSRSKAGSHEHRKTKKKTSKKDQGSFKGKKTNVKSPRKRHKNSLVVDKTQADEAVSKHSELKGRSTVESQEKDPELAEEIKALLAGGVANKEQCQEERAMEGAYTLFERTAAPNRPAVVVEPTLNVTCKGQPINASAPQRRFDSRVERG
ncbi:hypothetical protein Aduo_004027 [Ancylostoma duodenale]